MKEIAIELQPVNLYPHTKFMKRNQFGIFQPRNIWLTTLFEIDDPFQGYKWD